MIAQELKHQILQAFAFEPTPEQDAAIRTFCDFLTDRDPMAVMVMRGSAGTGKTALASAIVRALTALKQQLLLLAPTGRAAKVFSLNSGHDAYTIHRRIYRQETFTGEMTGFQLNFNQYHDLLVMVDEASMIANDSYGEAAFGSGRLLDDLVKYVYSGQNCRMVLIGDRAQLPPVGEEESPALLADVLHGYGMKVYESDLNQVLRQSEQSGILYNATVVRQMITRDEMTQLPRIRFHGFADIRMVPGDELIESLNSSYSRVGMDETIVITRSNKRANIYNHGIRNTVLGREEQLSTGDSLMVVRNNYYWSEQEKAPFPFIANGDRMRVLRVRHQRELYGFHFADAILSFPDYDDYELSCTVMLDTLTTEAPALTREQSDQLFAAVQEDYADVAQKAERMKKIRDDSYYNALQIKFAYAVTCHKAQGGQWEHVYVDQGYMTDDMLTNDYIHWLYTAFTRATDTLFLVNWPKTQTE
ncbi:MAG: AAA family ATPase [Prevotella sp.]|nr:AAA family ATPase [Prevotella sp.]